MDGEDQGDELPAIEGPKSTALAPRAVDRSLRFVAAREGKLGGVLRWGPASLGLILSAPFLPVGWAGAAVLGGLSLMGYGGLSAFVRSQWPDGILRARARLRKDPERGIRELENLSRSSMPDVFRLEAAGYAAILALDQGSVEHAIAISSFETRDAEDRVRARGVERGLIGELARSIIAWLSPGAFARVAHSGAFELEPEQREGLARASDVDEIHDLVGLLRVLESTTANDPAEALLAWRRCRDSQLSRRYPGLFLIAKAAAGRRLPRIRDELDAEIARDPAGRALLEKVFPEFARAGMGEGVYREAAPPVESSDEADRALALVSAPDSIARAASRIAGPLEKRAVGLEVLRRWAWIGGSVAAASVLLGAALAGPIGAWTSLVFSAYIAAPVGVIGAIRGMRRVKSKLAITPLYRLSHPPPLPWLAEFERSPVVRGPGVSLEAEHLTLYVACAEAERELGEGNAFTAWSLIEWYVRGFSARAVEMGALFPVAASLVRVSALSGHLEDARRMSDALASAKPRRQTWFRTGYGSAARALVVARALVFARSGKWEEAATQLELAGRLRQVWFRDPDAALFDLLVMVAKERTGRGSGDYDRERLEEHTPYLSSLVPELFADLGTTGPAQEP